MRKNLKMRKNLNHTVELILDGHPVTKTVEEWIQEKPRLLWNTLYTKNKDNKFTFNLTIDAYTKLKERIDEQNLKILKSINQTYGK